MAQYHARSGDPVAISGYLGSGKVLDETLTEFAFRDADQNEKDFQAFSEAVRGGRLQVTEE